MHKNSYSGKLIVFEGIDGSGKSTQSNLLISRLKKEGYETAMIDFPQYGKKSAGLVEEYLNGKYGSAEDVGPWRASIFYACDRYDASFKIREWLKSGKIVVCDRYFASNAGHQGGKIKEKTQWKKFIRWLYDLEYKIFSILKPDINFILKITPELSRRLSKYITDKDKTAKKRLYLGDKKQDMHEEDLVHLKKASESYERLAKEFPQDFKIIDCIENNELLSPEIIHRKIWEIVRKLI